MQHEDFSQQQASGADVLALRPTGLAICRTLAVIGFLEFAMRFGHDSHVLLDRSETLDYKLLADCGYPRFRPFGGRSCV